ncbi:hypothetical protein JTB14_032735 [Gonioctena quinquepunctata]|nr:hypothetical protein JTB14_032735 [Gonioctena quinquepunctata]
MHENGPRNRKEHRLETTHMESNREERPTPLIQLDMDETTQDSHRSRGTPPPPQDPSGGNRPQPSPRRTRMRGTTTMWNSPGPLTSQNWKY